MEIEIVDDEKRVYMIELDYLDREYFDEINEEWEYVMKYG